ncbi:GMP/IMP nucleotidase [Teredinibacter franksiae]|jgi:haloacid dehalogenase superfamily, subfamily IA, variant 3 with third motif having DD or ED|uniref:GMP/IMP nucleotidase n=1 Tax=Teredinibacter franksiae TaxID=2761453 RepID=UPI0016269307|nr:GMP/IMP nucleotidase [Teredinibacter franksiae]
MIDWQTIDTVLLDMDGTLLDLHFDNYFWLTHLPLRYAEAHQISEEEANAFLMEHIRLYEGSLKWYCLDHWSELVKMDIPALKREIQHKIQLRPYAQDFLSTLRQLQKKLVLITNAHPKGLELKLDITAIDQWLDIVISSHDYQLPKEDIGFWHELQAQEQFDPKRTVFIDDTPRVLAKAAEYGIAHLVCINQPDSQKPPIRSEKYLDICHFDEIMPPIHTG